MRFGYDKAKPCARFWQTLAIRKSASDRTWQDWTGLPLGDIQERRRGHKNVRPIWREIETKYEDLAEQINDPDVIANQTEWRKRMKEYSDMTPIVEKYREYKQAKMGIAESLAMLEESRRRIFGSF